ncbi:aminoacyl-tRNA deacylase [Maridesulfovibrio sp. FT414]|uniref:aminoacyl-tRNA deacylase n=1 Tax=Maridesulfovibrio sp. FT414 TaxID=2979469 RepID=UPI003D805BAD
METYENKLKAYLQTAVPGAEHLVFEQSCHSVSEAAQAAQATPEDFVKNVCMVANEDNLIVAIVRGTDRASTSRVAKALGIDKPRLATPEEILEKTGYPCGGTPSFGFPATFLVDPRVAEAEAVITGGGSERSLVKTGTREMLNANQAQVIRIRK